ncbi:MAG: SOS response-associated peptidase [Acidimicrobiia bacterium]|nr:SOS response-associated peptidase [Acidimicrobiia bacterium]
MCGRYVVTPDPDAIARFFAVDEVIAGDLGASYNVAPTDLIYGVAEHRGRRLLGEFRWGLIPWWSKEKGPLHINARAESVAAKPAFRDAFTRRRCLIPADGFYEWQSGPDGKQPFFIHAVDGEMLALAGIWSRWTDPETGREISTAAIVTTKSVGAVAALHDRMPVILASSLWDAWLDRDLRDPEEISHLLQPESELELHPVSKLVNRVQNNSPDCVKPI